MRPPWTTLVDVESLAEALRWAKLGEGTPLVILDVRVDGAGDVAGAVHAHVDRDLSGPVGPTTGRHPLPDVDAFIATCSA
ncbi:MAG TPA: sulfurtransferase, partial [Candidatus Thermoplasmatota archaeon]|nr:sulfurtransferase [Candidatus Thermoplasmatota archaeon]